MAGGGELGAGDAVSLPGQNLYIAESILIKLWDLGFNESIEINNPSVGISPIQNVKWLVWHKQKMPEGTNN